MRIALVSGTWTPGKCGVGDYSNRLAEALTEEGMDVTKISMENWSILNAGQYNRLLKQAAADIVHVQYPSNGYRRSILPTTTAYLNTDHPTLITMHEFQIYRSYWRLVFSPISLGMDARIFSRVEELDRFKTIYPKRKGEDLIIPIGSNIPSAKGIERQAGSVAFFGLFWPGKGLEQMLEFAALAKAEGIDMSRVSVIGAPVAGKEAFYDHIQEQAQTLGFNLYVDRPADEVAQLLSAHDYAYLPFPTGADERRGSMAAVLVNGCKLVTRYGPMSPGWVRDCTLEADTPADALKLIFQIGPSQSDIDRIASHAVAIEERYDWQNIARKHIELYSRLIEKGVSA